jgi:PPK2 family polyphosphate:nucleotide phosphotransferase
MDAAGKDSTIRRVLSGINPAGFRVHGFGAPSSLERSHDFLWRLNTRLPERGRIGVFNRSHYEEVLVVRVNPGFLAGQGIDPGGDLDKIWAQRFQAIRSWEAHLKSSKTTVVKFFLNVSKEEQRARLLARLDEPAKNWKFNGGDLDTRAQWTRYMEVYQDALNQTSTADSPWFCIPADDKKSMRVVVAQHLVKILSALDPTYPVMAAEERAKMGEYRAILEADK